MRVVAAVLDGAAVADGEGCHVAASLEVAGGVDDEVADHALGSEGAEEAHEAVLLRNLVGAAGPVRQLLGFGGPHDLAHA